MGRAPRDGEPERDGARVGDHDLEARRLGDDRRVPGAAGPDRGEHPLTTVLLRRNRHDEQLAVETLRDAARDEGADRGDDRDDATLHVAGTPPVHGSVANLTAPRVGRPRRRVTGGDDVDVTDEEEPPAARSTQPTDDDGQRCPRHFRAREIRIRGERNRIGLDPIGLEADLGEQPLDDVLDRLLRTGDRRNPDELAQVALDRGRRNDVAGADLGVRLHARRIGRVRHVGPPEPFSPISPNWTAWTSQPAASRPRRVTGLPSATMTTPGRTASTLQPSVAYSSSGTSTSRMPRSRMSCHSPTGSRGRKTTATSSATGDTTDSRWTSSAGPCQYGTSKTRTSPPTIAASCRAPASFVRRVRPTHRRSGRSQKVSPPPTDPGAWIRPRVGMPCAPVHASSTCGSPARLGLPGRSGIAPPSAMSSGSKT